MSVCTRIDDQKADARVLVDYLHTLSDRLGDRRLAEAAACLDGYQAGISLATPHPATGYALHRLDRCPCDRAALDPSEAPDRGPEPPRRCIDVELTPTLDGWTAEAEGHARVWAPSALWAIARLAKLALDGAPYYAVTIARGIGYRCACARWQIVEVPA